VGNFCPEVLEALGFYARVSTVSFLTENTERTSEWECCE